MTSTILSRPSWSHTFMSVVEALSKRSLCAKYQTAAIITKGTQIIATGYNGTFVHNIECCDYWENYWNINIRGSNNAKNIFIEWLLTDEFKQLHRAWSATHEIHAESNALSLISRNNIDATCKIYTLYSPCTKCALQIIAYGIKSVYYKHKYPHGDEAMSMLASNTIECVQVLS